MYAIIKTGGKQYRVQPGDVIDVELINAGEQGEVKFEEVLLLHDGSAVKVGAPNVAGCNVLGELLDEVKGPKVVSFKYKRRKNCHRKLGHRQRYSRVRIKEISA
ncbi:MAG: 50S ribosomal protein L21 [Waddliaceae bacterium]|nr:50S ribosomal protein L21 [Waddliaceae bacterium]